MKEIVSLKKILNNETVLQIYVCIVLGISLDANNCTDYHDLGGRFKHQRQCQREA